MKSELFLISVVILYSCEAASWSLNPITNYRTAVNKTKQTINDATETARNLREYGEKTLNEATKIRSISDATNLAHKVATDPINSIKQYGEEKLNNITEYGKSLTKPVTDPISSLIDFGGKTVNDMKNVRSIDDVTELGKNLVNDAIKEATPFIKKDPVLEAQKRQKAIMNDCISSTLSDLNPTQLEDFFYVSNNLTAIIQIAFDEAQQTAAQEAAQTESQTPPQASTSSAQIVEPQQTVNAQLIPEIPGPAPVLDFENIDRLLNAFEVMKHIGTLVPKCYSISDRTVQKFMDSN